MRLAKSIITALVCAALIGTNAWLAAMSFSADAFMNWSNEIMTMVKVNFAAHVLIVLSSIAGLAMVKLLWGAVAGALLKAGVAVWTIAYMDGAQFTSGAWGLVAFWLALAGATALLIHWNYARSDASIVDHPEREFA